MSLNLEGNNAILNADIELETQVKENKVEDIKNNAANVDYIVINDGSKDNTLEVLKENNYNH